MRTVTGKCDQTGFIKPRGYDTHPFIADCPEAALGDVTPANSGGVGVRFVDGISCDDDRYQSSQIALYPREEWWDFG